MVTGGNATVFISKMDESLKFYTEVLGMNVTSHYGDDWATVAAGGFEIGLHPKGEKQPAPGTRGATMVGLMVDDIQAAQARLQQAGVTLAGEIQAGDGGSFLHFHDPDGNELYLWQMPKW
jgi:predicted enzyme related to lactoylglutathione lyase